MINQLWTSRENLPRIHKGTMWRERRVFLNEDPAEVYNRGRPPSLGEICADDHKVQHVRTSGGYLLGGVSFGKDEFRTASKPIIGCGLDAERNLRIARENHFGMGPIRYLTLRWMHLVHLALVRADPSKVTITFIATNHGFWELGSLLGRLPNIVWRDAFGNAASAP